MKSKAAITNSVILTLSLVVFLGVPMLTKAQPLEPIIPGIIEGIETHFEITDSEYINIVLDSSEEIKLTMESIPEIVTIIIEPVSSCSATQITLSGFVPSTTYYKYQDDYHHLVSFTTDANGNYIYTQNLMNLHFVFIQTKSSTKFIKDDDTGGDCYQIGIWDSLTKTCTLTRDVNETVQIDSDSIIINGNNYIISGVYYGIYIFRKSNITIRNLGIETFYNGIAMFITHNSLIENNLISSYYGTGLNVRSANNNIFRGNTISNNGTGMWIGWYLFEPSSNNQIYNNNFIDNFSDIVYGPAIDNVFSLPIPVGGNYWSGFDTPEDGCTDLNNDNFCDDPHIISISGEKVIKDDLPWTKRNGWIVEKTLHEKVADLAKELANHPEGYLWGGKGWDYSRSEFIPSFDILAGYEYLRELTGVGVDCSGLITWAFNRAFDRFVPAINNFVKYVNANGLYSDPQSDAVVEAGLLPGDAIFFDWDGDEYIDHTAMYVGESGSFNVVNAKSRDFGIVTEVKNNYKQLAGFNGFRRIHEGVIDMEVTVGSPIDIIVTDPDGFIITPDTIIPSDEEYIREIPGILYYSELERGDDDNPIDRVYSPVLKIGNYTIKVTPSSGSLPTDTYTLRFRGGSQTITLAENIPISQIASEGYGVAVTETGIITPFIPIVIDIKPGSFPNSINLNSKGATPVAIFGNNTFDVYQINLSSVTLAGAPIKLKNNGQPMTSYEDVNNDSFIDIIAHVITKDLQLTLSDTQANLEGKLIDGTTIKGSDSVRIVH